MGLAAHLGGDLPIVHHNDEVRLRGGGARRFVLPVVGHPSLGGPPFKHRKSSARRTLGFTAGDRGFGGPLSSLDLFTKPQPAPPPPTACGLIVLLIARTREKFIPCQKTTHIPPSQGTDQFHTVKWFWGG